MSERRRPSNLGLFLAVTAVVMAYALYTQSAWEDWYITYRASKNLALGNGLVFNPGERVHSFTSPLGTLLPALLSWSLGNTSDAAVLWLFRLLSSCAIGATAVALRETARLQHWSSVPTLVLLALFVVDAKVLEFSTGGMETAFTLVFLGLTLRGFAAGGRRSARAAIGIGWGGLMWTRPDGFIYAGGLAVGFLLFCPAAAGSTSRAGLLRTCAAAGGIALALYLPWLLWAWSYYGSPVPHSVIAKSLGLPLLTLLVPTLTYPLRILGSPAYGDPTFLPANYGFEGWPKAVLLLANLTAVAAAYWLIPVASRFARAVSFAFMPAHLYATVYIPTYPWYCPAVALLGYFVCAAGLEDALRGIAWLRRGRAITELARLEWLAKGAAVAVVLFSLAVTVSAAYQLRIQQRVIEEGNRKQIGLWLGAHADRARDTVFLEPLGYIGFFSGLRIYDVPGLSSPAVVAARREVGDEWTALIRRLVPDWVVLRPPELERVNDIDPALLRDNYELVKTFDVSDTVRSYRWIPGRDFLMFDQTFFVFRRRPAATRQP